MNGLMGRMNKARKAVSSYTKGDPGMLAELFHSLLSSLWNSCWKWWVEGDRVKVSLGNG